MVTLTETAGNSPPVTDTWVVGAAIGVGKARDIALDRKSSSQMLLPLAAAASHVARDGAHVDPASPPPPPALARLEALAARRFAAGGARVATPKPGRGVCAPLPTHASKRGTSGDDDGGYGADGLLSVARTLERLPAVVMAHFALERGGGRGLAEFLDDPAASVGGGSNASRPPAPDATRREWNRALCQCLAAAYGAMVGHARVAPSPELPADTFYAMWPLAERVGLPAPPDLDPDGRPVTGRASAGAGVVGQGKGHPVAELVLYPVYKELVDQPLFRSLGSRALVKASDGYFLPAGFAVNEGVDGATWAPGFSGSSRIVARPLAAGFIARHFPVLDAPAWLRPELAAAGAVTAARELTASALRRLLRAKPPPADVRTHVELVECACSDIDPGPVPGPGTSAPPSPSRQGTIPAMFGHARRPAGDGPPGGDAIDGIMSVVNEMFGQAGIAPPSNAASNAASNAGPPLDLSAVRDLSGIPVPTASGAPAALGHQGLYSGSENMVALVPTMRGKFLHPALTTSPTIGALVRHAQFRSELRVSVFTPRAARDGAAQRVAEAAHPDGVRRRARRDLVGRKPRAGRARAERAMAPRVLGRDRAAGPRRGGRFRGVAAGSHPRG